jgi:Sec-independent protein secretion pathway component TatC
LNRALAANNLPQTTQVLGLAEFILIQFKLSIIFALILSAPWVLWQAWMFIRPGLYVHERRFVNFLLPVSAILTAVGVALMYFIMLPLMLQVLILIGSSFQMDPVKPPIDARVQTVIDGLQEIPLRLRPPDQPVPGQAWIVPPEMKLHVAVARSDGSVEIIDYLPPSPGAVTQAFRLDDYVDFALMLFLGTAIAFQMPLVVLLLGWIGIASTDWLKKKRKYALMICTVAAAAITPTADAVSMFMMLIPLYGLYELGIVLLWLMPARVVAEGRVFSLRRSDKAVPRAAQTEESSQTTTPATPARATEQSRAEQADDSEVGP